jgi:hypothetical protein
MSEQDHLDALAQGSQRGEETQGRQKHEQDVGEKKSVFVTGTIEGMRYERTRVLSARGAKKKECNDEYSD